MLRRRSIPFRLFQDCQQAFSKARIALILDTVKRRIDTLHVGTLDALLRDGFTYLIEVRFFQNHRFEMAFRFVVQNDSCSNISFRKNIKRQRSRR